jgi:hypothetical protein
MTTLLEHPTPEYIAHLVDAARTERAKAVRRAFLALFRWHAPKERAWPTGKAPVVSVTSCG